MIENLESSFDFDPQPLDVMKDPTPSEHDEALCTTFAGDYFPCERGYDDLKKLKPYTIVLGLHKSEVVEYGHLCIFKREMKDVNSVFHKAFKQLYPDFVSLHTYYVQEEE